MIIYDLELSNLLAQLHIFAPTMKPLYHIFTMAYNTTAQCWVNRGSTRSSMVVEIILKDFASLNHLQNINASVGRVKGEDKNVSDSALKLNHLPKRLLLHHLNIIFPQKIPWWMLTLLPAPADFHSA